MAIQQRDREEWFFHPVTREFLEMLRASRQDTMETWAREGFVAENPNVAALANAKALGGVAVLDQAIVMMEEFKPVVVGITMIEGEE